MSGDIPHELDDVLFFVSALGNSPGWGKIQEEAAVQKRSLDFKPNGYSNADLAMKAWLHDWPRNQDLLGQSLARAIIHHRSSYTYYVPTKDVRKRYRTPDDAALKAFRERLSDYFEREGLGRGTSVVHYDFEKEIWFLVRYPGQVERYAAISEDGEPTSHVFKPEEYDAIVYHKEFGDLRLNTNRPSDHVRYRIDIADLLLDASNVFSPSKRVITLNPLLGKCLHIFKCQDIDGLAEIAPTEICYASLHSPGSHLIWRADKNHTLLSYRHPGDTLIPDETAHSIKYAKFQYRLRDRTRIDRLTVHAGNVLTYARDGDSSVLEDWLRRRGFIQATLN